MKNKNTEGKVFTGRLIILLLVFAVCCGQAHRLMAQGESISGTVMDQKTKETIVGAAVIIQGTTTGASTDLNGVFTIKGLQPGSYNIVVSYISYKKQIIENVKVEKGKTTELNIELEEEITTIQGATITASRRTDTEISMISSIKASNLVVSGVSSQMIAKSQDRDAAEVIKRVPGITLQGNRFVIIRGLSERYNTVWLNGSATPSSETDIRAFSFDMVPSSLIDNILVYKTPAPELPGDFAGAAIQIFTKNLPDQKGVSVSYSASYRSTTSLKEFYKYEGGKYDWLGFDDGTRSLPKDFPDAHLNEIPRTTEGKALRTEIGRSLNKIWTAAPMTAPLDNRLSLGLAGKFRWGKVSINNITSLNYSNTYDTRSVYRANYLAYDTINDVSDTAYYFNDKVYSNTAKIGALHNWALVFGNNQLIEFRNLFNQAGTSITTLSEGRDNYGGSDIRSQELNYQNRSIYAGQLGGRHKFRSEAIKLDWTLGYSWAGKNQPDIRRITMIRNDDPTSEYYDQYGVNFNFAANTDLNGRIYLKMDENIYTAAVNYEHKLRIGSWFPEIKSGVYIEKKDRSFRARLLGYAIAKSSSFNWEIAYLPLDSIFADTNINATTGLKIDEQTNDIDSYNADHLLLAAYVGLKLPVFSRMNLYTGVRFESYDFNLRSGSADDPVLIENDTINWFPSANLTYSITEKSLLRLAWGMTINRPEYREIAPFNFFVYELKAYYKGNTALKSAYIHNIDLRYELYPTLYEMITIGAFYKRFTNPIEATMYAAGSGWDYTFTNADYAQCFGAEIDMRKSFANWSKRYRGLRWMRDLTLVFNASYINSRVIIPNASEVEKDRPMQGQSPYIVNVGMFYQNDSIGLSAGLMYNIVGKRIAFIGNAVDPHTWEMPRNLLDFNISKKIGKWFSIKASVNDILNQSVVFKQTEVYSRDLDGDGQGDEEISRDQMTRTFKPGTYFTLGFGLSF